MIDILSIVIMTTPMKQYQNVSFQELMQYSIHNPHRDRTLESIEIHASKPSSQETSLDKLGLKGYQITHLDPTGIISLYACISDPDYYSLAAPHARTQLVIDLATNLQEETEQLRNTHLSRKRKKIYDLIGAVYHGSVLEDKDYLDLYAGLSCMKQTQFVLMKSSVQENIEEGEQQYDSSLKGEILFSSSPETWKRDLPIWLVDYRSRWVAIPTAKHAESMVTMMASWIIQMEQSGWIIQWPEMEGTKTELVEQLSLLPSWQPSDKSLKKETLACRLGKLKSMAVFANWQRSSTHDDITA
jgi:hypothetical protein